MEVSQKLTGVNQGTIGTNRYVPSQQDDMRAPQSFSLVTNNAAPAVNDDTEREPVSFSNNVGESSSVSAQDFLSNRLNVPSETKSLKHVASSYGTVPNNVLKSDDVLTVIDLTVGKNESLGNDMVLLKFNDGSLRQTQKGLFEAADKLGVFARVKSGDAFADWHLNEWALGVVSNPDYISAHDEFNTSQTQYDLQLRTDNPEIFEARLSFVKQYAPTNLSAIEAAEKDLKLNTPDEPVMMIIGSSEQNEFVDTGQVLSATAPIMNVIQEIEPETLSASDRPEPVSIDVRTLISDTLPTVRGIDTFDTFLEITGLQAEDNQPKGGRS